MLHQKLESIQYRACLAITGAIGGTSREKIYQELGLESLQSRRWYRKLAMFYKIYKDKNPFYLFKVIPEKTSSYATRNVGDIPIVSSMVGTPPPFSEGTPLSGYPPLSEANLKS